MAPALVSRLSAQLCHADKSEAQVVALRAIKNDLIGHAARKLEYIHHGLIPLLVKVLPENLGTGVVAGTLSSSGDEDKVVIQVASLVGIIAHGGPGFVQPILHSALLRRLFAQLAKKPSPKVALAVLRCLNAVADNLPPAPDSEWTPDRRLSNLVFHTRYITVFTELIGRASAAGISHDVCDAALALLCKTCSSSRQKDILVEAGVLSALCSRLSSFVMSEGFVLPLTEDLAVEVDRTRHVPASAVSNVDLSRVLETIGVVIEFSKARAEQFMYDATMTKVLPIPVDDFLPSDMRAGPRGSVYFSGAAVPRSRNANPLDYFLPHVPDLEKDPVSDQSGFPPLSSIAAAPKRRVSLLPTIFGASKMNIPQDLPDDREESSVVPFLLLLVRSFRGKCRLLAMRLLVILYNLQLVPKSRGQSFTALLVPLLARMLDEEEVATVENEHERDPRLLTGLHYSKLAPTVLASLIVDNKDFQKAAVEARTIAKLSVSLKATFEGAEAKKETLWNPHRLGSAMQSPTADSQTSPGAGGPSLAARHVMAFREGLLQALAALAPFNDEYRREICDQGVLPQIMLALEPFHAPAATAMQSQTNPGSGSSPSALLAACGAIRSLTRSVTALRTRLVDAEVVKPVIKLMGNSDPEIRIAATKVIANLAMDFSPMKESVSEAVLVKKLCEQVHSANARLRLESIWALKLLVFNAPNRLKRDVVNELGPNWIKQLISTDPADIPPGEVIGLVPRDYRTYTPGVLGRYKESSDVVMSGESSTEDEEDTNFDSQENSHPEASYLDNRDTEYNRHTVEDDTAIQEQLLDLIRNLFCGEKASEIIEYVLAEMGQDEFFKILLSRLKSKTFAGATRKENQTTSAPSGVVVKVLYILVHIAASASKYRTTISSNTTLMKQVLTFTSHPDREVRVQCCWIAINLTYEDDPSDRARCRNRAGDLQQSGFFPHLRKLENDAELDVRERAKTAIHLIGQLIAS